MRYVCFYNNSMILDTENEIEYQIHQKEHSSVEYTHAVLTNEQYQAIVESGK